MQIDITGHHTDITPTLREFVEKSVYQLAEYTDIVLQGAHVVLEVTKNVYRCDIHIKTDKGPYIAKDNADDMYVAIDRSSQKIRRQIEVSKGKNISRRNN